MSMPDGVDVHIADPPPHALAPARTPRPHRRRRRPRLRRVPLLPRARPRGCARRPPRPPIRLRAQVHLPRVPRPDRPRSPGGPPRHPSRVFSSRATRRASHRGRRRRPRRRTHPSPRARSLSLSLVCGRPSPPSRPGTILHRRRILASGFSSSLVGWDSSSGSDAIFEPLLRALDERNAARAACAVLTERRVLLRSRQRTLLVSAATALVESLRPMRWRHVFVPLLPAALASYVEAHHVPTSWAYTRTSPTGGDARGGRGGPRRERRQGVFGI